MTESMKDAWRTYRDQVYPSGIDGVQNRECHQAFFAGALSVLNIYDAIAALPGERAVVEYEKLRRQIVEVCRFRLETLKSRN